MADVARYLHPPDIAINAFRTVLDLDPQPYYPTVSELLLPLVGNRIIDLRGLGRADTALDYFRDYTLLQGGENLDDFPYSKRWFEGLTAWPAVERGMAAGSELSVDYSKLSKDDIKRLRAMLYNQRARPAPEGGLS